MMVIDYLRDGLFIGLKVVLGLGSALLVFAIATAIVVGTLKMLGLGIYKGLLLALHGIKTTWRKA